MFPKLPRPGHEHSETDPGHPIHWTTLKIFNNITLVHEAGMVTLEWIANPLNDMYADAVTTFVLEIQSNPKAQKVDGKTTYICLETRTVSYEDDSLKEMVELAVPSILSYEGFNQRHINLFIYIIVPNNP
ncbi:hypothetical protein J4Q44_G00247930 [Coregonus suidteri]|uniref:Pre-mRNA 3'-end-processing endonuclease polyadenylation factor C-term domain-containing protein n=1 Tax=Coregonus suidteri TaxID=861788 RepID=A0AAN8QWN8_9TELE